MTVEYNLFFDICKWTSLPHKIAYNSLFLGDKGERGEPGDSTGSGSPGAAGDDGDPGGIGIDGNRGPKGEKGRVPPGETLDDYKGVKGKLQFS